ncbi:ribonuclease D [Syntrophobacter fumaroxidans]|uniref:3'-5' exonuclease n=1 Tax=Syntrophobacter fumaroxidans (strain DSM 10017 / MPOB) TaxID=335543 RepID=A0LFB2_SYNFM|nr:ribonuclease D [Syntrophobacter fumaroxidans]ABK16114.1 3'-5' exonuclease [Syntrophobacter fumaroxidans MPOB]
MNPVVVIEKPSELDALVRQLSTARHLAVDTESNSFYAYFDRVCLIQISSPERDYIIDPLSLKDLSVLGRLFENPRIEKVLHAASNDVLGLRRDFQFRFNGLFDTAIACKLLGYKQLGLSKILETHFGVSLNKRWQRYDWGKRPLVPDQLDYARLDTHYLIALRHMLAADLQSRELWAEACEAFEKASEQQVPEKTFHPRGFLQINGARSLDAAGKSILKALYMFREKEARRRDRAPFRIMSNEALLRLADARPDSVDEISRIKGLPRSFHDPKAASFLIEIIRQNNNSNDTEARE